MRTQLYFLFLFWLPIASRKIGSEFISSEIVKVEGIVTTIAVKEKHKSGEKVFVTEIERIYPDGSVYKEQDRYWNTKLQALHDVKDWVDLAKLTDW